MPTPAPGPITQALKRLSLKSSANWIGLSTARTITAVSAAALTASASRGEASVTSPAPALSAARAAIRAAPVEAISPDSTSTWPRAYLWPSIARHRKRSAPELRRVLEGLRTDFVEHARVDPDIGDAHAAALQPAGQQQMRGLLAEERHRFGGAHRRAHHGAEVPLTPLGKSTASTGAPVALIASITSKASPLDLPAQARAEQRIDDQRRPADRLRIERQHRIFPALRGRGGIALAARRARTSG